MEDLKPSIVCLYYMHILNCADSKQSTSTTECVFHKRSRKLIVFSVAVCPNAVLTEITKEFGCFIVKNRLSQLPPTSINGFIKGLSHLDSNWIILKTIGCQ